MKTRILIVEAITPQTARTPILHALTKLLGWRIDLIEVVCDRWSESHHWAIVHDIKVPSNLDYSFDPMNHVGECDELVAMVDPAREERAAPWISRATQRGIPTHVIRLTDRVPVTVDRPVTWTLTAYTGPNHIAIA